MKTDTEKLRDYISRIEAFVSSKAARTADREKLIASAGFDLDTRIGERLAGINATLDLADELEARLLKEAPQWSSIALQSATNCLVAQDDVNVALRASILRSLPEDVRDSVDVLGSKAYKSEVDTRHYPEMHTAGLADFGMSITKTLEHLRTLLKAVTANEAETLRCRNLVRKLAA